MENNTRARKKKEEKSSYDRRKKSALKYWQRRRKLSNVIVIEAYYNFECDWLIELSVSNLASELVKIGFFFRSTTVEEIEIFIIKENYYKAAVTSANW